MSATDSKETSLLPRLLRGITFHFGLLLNIALGFGSTFINLSASFGVSYAKVSEYAITISSGSYAVGVVFISPFGDLCRPHCGPRPPERRATALSVVISGLLLGVLVARVLAGVLGQFPPGARNDGTDLTYARILWTMTKFAVTEPALIQACLINFATSAAFTSFWVTLTFLLSGPIYNYSTLDIGLFGLVGMLGVLCGPVMGRFIDRLVPWYSQLSAVILLGIFNTIQMGAGGISVAAVIVVAFALNLFRQLLQAALATTVLSISDEARGRLNAVNVLCIFLGQVMGTSVGSHIYLQHGWRACAALSVGLSGWQLFVLLARGPHCPRYTWFGYKGEWRAGGGHDVVRAIA
ncbi:major facilitator superfamily domain-containing protein [Mycena sp. CBHHK59/15]|nr:major facilitator superfamily domain-containing protein [Mycena sp. CBHHK59/15]